jgi:hypothetical protein
MPSHRQGQKSQVATVYTPIAVTPTAAPIAATLIIATPMTITVALNATMLQHPQRQQ